MDVKITITDNMSPEDIMAAVTAARQEEEAKAKAAEEKEAKVKAARAEAENKFKAEAPYKLANAWIQYTLCKKDNDGEEYLDLADVDNAGCEIEDLNTNEEPRFYGPHEVVTLLITTPSGYDERNALCFEEMAGIEMDELAEEAYKAYPDRDGFYYNGIYAHEFNYDAYTKAKAEAFLKITNKSSETLKAALIEAIEDAVSLALWNSGNDSDRKIGKEHFGE